MADLDLKPRFIITCKDALDQILHLRPCARTVWLGVGNGASDRVHRISTGWQRTLRAKRTSRGSPSTGLKGAGPLHRAHPLAGEDSTGTTSDWTPCLGPGAWEPKLHAMHILPRIPRFSRIMRWAGDDCGGSGSTIDHSATVMELWQAFDGCRKPAPQASIWAVCRAVPE